MTFEEYCISKKIAPELFEKAEPERYREWKSIFSEMHPNSFTEQKKFLINHIRRAYKLVLG